MFSTEVHTCGEIQHETLKVHCILFYLLFKMYNMYAEILFCCMRTCGIRVLAQVPKIRIFTHMYISMSACMQLEFVLHSLPSLPKEEVSVNSFLSIQFSFIPAQFRMLLTSNETGFSIHSHYTDYKFPTSINHYPSYMLKTFLSSICYFLQMYTDIIVVR